MKITQKKDNEGDKVMKLIMQVKRRVEGKTKKER